MLRPLKAHQAFSLTTTIIVFSLSISQYVGEKFNNIHKDMEKIIICSVEVGSYSGLSNKRAGRNKMGRSENRAKFERFENLNLCWMDPNHF